LAKLETLSTSPRWPSEIPRLSQYRHKVPISYQLRQMSVTVKTVSVRRKFASTNETRRPR